MLRSHRWSVLAFLAVLSPLLTAARAAPPAAEEWSDERALTVAPKAAPVPELKYRLFPLDSERKPGNAAPIYLRFAHERLDETKKELYEKPAAWLELPPDKLPVQEAREFLRKHHYNLHQMELAARRQSCDWNYTLEVENLFAIRIPDTQEMRMHAKLLALQARVEIAEGDVPAAVNTLETGFAFSQQVGAGPFLIHGLVGLSLANGFADGVAELVQRPDAPNLYWSLTALPRPLIDLRKALEFEQGLLELMFPDLTDLERPRTAEQWEAALKRVREKIKVLAGDEKPPEGLGEPLTAAQEVQAGRKYLVEHGGRKSAEVEAMPAAQVQALFLVAQYREYRDAAFKVTYLPPAEARPAFAATEKRLETDPNTEALRLARMLLPKITKVELTQARTARKVAALRVVEALRLHAARAGKLPDKLDEVAVVPIPTDPVTGKPFEYQHDGQTATLTSRLADDPVTNSGLRYRVTLRK